MNKPENEHPAAQNAWETTGNRRRLILLALVVLPSLFSASVLYSLLPTTTGRVLNYIITVLFVILFAWISIGFWSSVTGVWLVLRRFDRFSPCANLPENLVIPGNERTALLFPIYNEDTKMVAEGVRAVWQSLRETGLSDRFDVFILSDSTNPETWVLEEEAWYSLIQGDDTSSNACFPHIFYRRRKANLKRKSGNIADFCRRWGANYKYMIIFDADSIMSGRTLVRMVQAMEARPDLGILQTPPKAIRSRSLIARAQQFANHLYGPIFAAGLHYWQLGDAQYWGHNAIIRTEPFMRYCQLPSLPGKSPLGGDILSHDFVESALMRRAGYGVWLAYDLEGSFEQCPPTLVDELIRDKRWCHGNLQHSRLLFTRGFFPTHRALFINGIMSYGSALLWFFFLMASSAQALAELLIIPNYFPTGPSLFPDWPKYFPDWALALVGSTAGLLFLPKIIALLLVIARGGAAFFGGVFRMSLSVMAEVLISTALAPVRMLFHSFFVVSTLLGWGSGWGSQNREQETGWWEAFCFHWWGSLLGLAWGGVMYIANPGFFLWLSPIIAGLALSIPLSVLTGKTSLGDMVGRIGLFLTPVETNTPPELTRFEEGLKRPEPYCPFPQLHGQGFLRAVIIPRVFSLHMTLVSHSRRNSPEKTTRLASLAEKALAGSPHLLSLKDKTAILSDPACLRTLHRAVWKLDDERARLWGIR